MPSRLFLLLHSEVSGVQFQTHFWAEVAPHTPQSQLVDFGRPTRVLKLQNCRGSVAPDLGEISKNFVVALRCVALRSFVRARASWFLAVRNQKVKFCHEKITFKFLWGSLEYHVYSCFWYFTEAVLLQNRHIGAFNVADYIVLSRIRRTYVEIFSNDFS